MVVTTNNRVDKDNWCLSSIEENKNNISTNIFNQVAKTDFDFSAYKKVPAWRVGNIAPATTLPLIFIEKIKKGLRELKLDF